MYFSSIVFIFSRLLVVLSCFCNSDFQHSLLEWFVFALLLQFKISEMSVPQPREEHLSVLRKYFGHFEFRPMQWKIIYSIITEKQDNCVIMATGYGKSLCYQYPAVYCQGLTIVISPLISLMQDQVLSLQMSNISACFLGSAQQAKKQSLDDVLSGICRVLYVTPEWSVSENGERTLLQIISCRQVTLLAVDEAHCVSQWGHDFRSAYRNLANLRKILPDVPILALTATATLQVRNDICRSLKLRNPKITITSFNRPNLYFSVSVKTKSNKPDQVYRNLTVAMENSGLGYRFSGPTIIYCPSKNRTEEVADVLKRRGIKCGAYHAGLSLRERSETHKNFLRDQLEVVVATVAFGMGIDKPNVRCVIHYGQPKDIESYYQEVGRAGRDGLPALCHVCYSSEDTMLNKMIMSTTSNVKFQEYKELMAKRMQYFCETRHCRRRVLLSYFEKSVSDESQPPEPNCCDNCDKLLKKSTNERSSMVKVDLSQEIKLLLEVFDYFEGRFGLGVPIKFIRGLKDSKIPENKFSNRLFGAGKEHNEVAWKALAKLCIRENLLTEKAVQSFKGHSKYRNFFPLSTVSISQKGRDFVTRGFKDGVPFELSEQAEMLFRKKRLENTCNQAKTASQSQSGSWQDNLSRYKNDRSVKKQEEQQALMYRELQKLRDSIAENLECAPHMILENSTCFLMALSPPSNVKELANVKGFNETKIEKFGQIFLDKIKEFFGTKDTEQSEHDTNDQREEFSKMKQLNENAINYNQLAHKYVEYILTDEVLNDLETDLVLPSDSNISSSNDAFNNCTPAEQSPTENMWGNETDAIFDDLPLEQIVADNQERYSSSPSACGKNLASQLFSMHDSNQETRNERTLASCLVSMDDSLKESIIEKNLTSSLFTIDSSWKESKKNEFTSSLLSADNDWSEVKKGKNVTSSLVSVHNKWDEIKQENDRISSLVSVHDEKKENSTSVLPIVVGSGIEEKKAFSSYKTVSKGGSIGKSHIVYEDDTSEDEKPTFSESKKRSVPLWLTQPEAIKKRMKSNSIFKLK